MPISDFVHQSCVFLATSSQSNYRWTLSRSSIWTLDENREREQAQEPVRGVNQGENSLNCLHICLHSKRPPLPPLSVSLCSGSIPGQGRLTPATVFIWIIWTHCSQQTAQICTRSKSFSPPLASKDNVNTEVIYSWRSCVVSTKPDHDNIWCIRSPYRDRLHSSAECNEVMECRWYIGLIANDLILYKVNKCPVME